MSPQEKSSAERRACQIAGFRRVEILSVATRFSRSEFLKTSGAACLALPLVGFERGVWRRFRSIAFPSRGDQ